MTEPNRATCNHDWKNYGDMNKSHGVLQLCYACRLLRYRSGNADWEYRLPIPYLFYPGAKFVPVEPQFGDAI